jgi:hypothetical protein
MNYCVVVQAHGKELDELRGKAYRISREVKTDWYAEQRDSGTAFCFESTEAQKRFCATCEKENVNYKTER